MKELKFEVGNYFMEKFTGKLVVRTKAIKLPRGSVFIYSDGPDYDTSYTTHPILIEKVVNGIVFYREKPRSKVNILGPKFHDENWAEIPEEYRYVFWPEILDEPRGER